MTQQVQNMTQTGPEYDAPLSNSNVMSLSNSRSGAACGSGQKVVVSDSEDMEKEKKVSAATEPVDNDDLDYRAIALEGIANLKSQLG